MPAFKTALSQKLYRAGEAADLLLKAPDLSSKRVVLDCYANLSKPSLYAQMVELSLTFSGKPFRVGMRCGDLFTVGEILHEGQYKLQSPIPPRPFIVDAGANIGISALWFLGCYRDARLHAFEPASENYLILDGNLRGLDGVKSYQAAIGKQAGTATLHHAEHAAMHSLLPHDQPGPSEQVPVVSLAEHMKTNQIQRIDILKLDVEGSELDALIGLGDRIRDVGVIVGEMHESVVNPDDFYGFLEQNNFRVCWKRYFHDGQTQQVHGFEAVARDSR